MGWLDALLEAQARLEEANELTIKRLEDAIREQAASDHPAARPALPECGRAEVLTYRGLRGFYRRGYLSQFVQDGQ